jgi:hypothetical protein
MYIPLHPIGHLVAHGLEQLRKDYERNKAQKQEEKREQQQQGENASKKRKEKK